MDTNILNVSSRSNSGSIHTWELHLKLDSNFASIFIYNTKFHYNFSIQWKQVNKELKFYNYNCFINGLHNTNPYINIIRVQKKVSILFGKRKRLIFRKKKKLSPMLKVD